MERTRESGDDRLDEAAAPPDEQPDGAEIPRTPGARGRGRRGRSRARGALLFLLAVAAFFSASAFWDAGPRGVPGEGTREGREGAEAPGSGGYVPPGMRCGAANLCEEGGGAREAPGSAAEPEGDRDGR